MTSILQGMKPSVFLALDYEAALARARQEGRVLLVAVTASGSPACEVMDQVTWTDPKVVARIGEAALAIQLDFDADDWTVKMLTVKSTPALVAFDRGGEIGRVVGSLGAPELLAWLDGIALGETFAERRRREVVANPKDAFRRLQLAGALLNSGALEEATTEHVWLWKHMLEHEPKMASIKHGPFVETVKKLVTAHPPAREAFSALRAASPPTLDVEDVVAFTDWWSLNKALGEEAKTLAWFDEHGDRALAAAWLAPAVVKQVEPLLVAADRWADVGKLHPRPLLKFRDQITLRAGVRVEIAAITAVAPPGPAVDSFAFTLAAVDEKLRETAYTLVRALRAAGRENDAKQIAAAAADADDSPEMAAALDGRYTPPDLKALLKPAG